MNRRFDINHLNLFGPDTGRHCLFEYLTSMRHTPWGDLSKTDFNGAWLRLQEKLSPDPALSRLLHLYLLSHLIESSIDTPDWAAPLLKAHLIVDHLLPGLTWDRLASGRWVRVPVPLVTTDGARIRYFMAGALPPASRTDLWPDWVQGVMDKTSLCAIHAAAEAAGKACPNALCHCLYCYPLSPANEHCQFTGTSLGLPMVLGFMKALTGKTTSERYLATGGVSPDGGIEKVEGVAEKLALAAESAHRTLFLYPNANLCLKNTTDIEALPVSDVQEAWMIIRRYRPGSAKTLAMFADMLKTPEAFVAGMNRIDSMWVKREAKSGKCREVMARITARPELFSATVKNLSLRIENRDLAGAAVFMDLFSEKILEKLSGSAPLSLFNFYTLRLALANHQGNIRAADHWADCAQSLLPVALKGDLNLYADFSNHRFVTRHNRYRFDSRLPHDLMRVMEFMKRRHQDQCEFGCPVEPVLGRLHGTIAQNYAFCGPAYLAETKAHTAAAMAAFGGG